MHGSVDAAKSLGDAVEHYRNVFRYFDTDHDGLLDRKTASHVMRLVGFETSFAGHKMVASETLVSKAIAMEKSLTTEGQARRSFNTMRGTNRKNVFVTSKELHAHLDRVGMTLTEEHANRLAEIISKQGDDFFTADELVEYITTAYKTEKKAAARALAANDDDPTREAEPSPRHPREEDH